ncbi:MAG: CDP-glucose 4,6-dehydratase [Candidatus Geothermincolia bacterium]
MQATLAFWKGKRVFLTGHTGFKGSWLSLLLQELGAKVTGYALDPSTEPSLFVSARVSESITSIQGDVRNLHTLCTSMSSASPEIVIHMAAQSLVRESYREPVLTYDTNVMGTVNLLEAVRRTAGVRAVINVTTDKCYENREWVWGYRENDRLGGHDPYSNSKACSELVTSAYRNAFFCPEKYGEHGVAVASARAGNVIGGGDWSGDRLLPDCVRAVLEGRRVVIRNPGAIRPWQYVLEPLLGYLTLARLLYEKGPQFGKGWNFGPEDQDAKSVEWIVRRFCELWGEGAECEFDSGTHPHETRSLRLDCSQARNELGWHALWNTEKAIEAIVAWMVAYREGRDMRQFSIGQIRTFLDDCGGKP